MCVDKGGVGGGRGGGVGVGVGVMPNGGRGVECSHLIGRVRVNQSLRPAALNRWI